MALLIGFVLGILASAVAGVMLDRATSPRLQIVCDPGERALLVNADGRRQVFLHVVVKQAGQMRGLPTRRPAWACEATFEVYSQTGELLTTEAVRARWASQPEPTSSFVIGERIIPTADLAKMIAGRRLDIHAHRQERLSVAIKHDGVPEVYLFSNESYRFERGQNPAWRLETGTYRVRVSVFYERGNVSSQFLLRNAGPSVDDAQIEPWGANGTA